ncbi:hypothetical protein [Puniceibacterium confluentis]|uniref:hypothetical protein n=1 Tax=Puniceibacterium confluentis TaxID=1958944 RepID=UPI0011B3D543|nr:hypothetical protein [Puniceibacterium confluentis]
MAFIQKLPVTGTGAKLYPDAAMDAGTRGLLDMLDPWSWGGTVPPDGALAVDAGPRNYALAEDGWVEDAARAVTSTMLTSDGAVQFVDTDDILRLPVGFRQKVDDTHLGLIYWAKNIPDPAGAGSSNTIFASATAASVNNFSIGAAYSSPGVISAARVRCNYTNAWVVPAAIQTAMFDGALHQLGFEFELASDGLSVTYRVYLDGLFVASTSLSVNGVLYAPTVSEYAAFGQHPVGGSTLRGTLWRAMMQELEVEGARAFADTVALDYEINKARILAVSG